MAHETHVLLVEHDSIDQDMYTKMLQHFFNKGKSNSYPGHITTVRLASTGISILLKGEVQFDVVMTSMNSPDSCVFQLLEAALQMNLLVILMSNNDDAITTMRALDNAALFGIKKPLTMQIMNNLWQHVAIDKHGRLKQNEQAIGVIEQNTFSNDTSEDNLVDSVESKYKFQKKVWVEWTEELHDKFMRAVKHLGEGRCYPRAILNLMNVPELSRMQVASHLQRCRKSKWIPMSLKKSKSANMFETSATSKKKAPRTKTMSFGSMPNMNHKIDIRQEFNIDIRTSTDTNTFVGNFSDGYQYPQLINDIECETFDMMRLGHVFGMDDEPFVVYDVESVDPMAHILLNERDITRDVFDFPDMAMDLVVETSFDVDPQRKLEMDLNGTLEGLVFRHLKPSQVPAVCNASNQEIDKDGVNE
ncbi:hypothetical protein CASFOL_038224 [Castilleja foliolosa]|uniref:Uncharacterized protein n=1 Tax=Castilleja foliolosa TaxID=1961234 RepID=A0ABD3BKC9_9LAMI